MCYAIEKIKEDAARDAARNAAILATIETLRDIHFSEEDIKSKIMEKYNLTEGESEEFMLKKSA